VYSTPCIQVKEEWHQELINDWWNVKQQIKYFIDSLKQTVLCYLNSWTLPLAEHMIYWISPSGCPKASTDRSVCVTKFIEKFFLIRLSATSLFFAFLPFSSPVWSAADTELIKEQSVTYLCCLSYHLPIWVSSDLYLINK